MALLRVNFTLTFGTSAPRAGQTVTSSGSGFAWADMGNLAAIDGQVASAYCGTTNVAQTLLTTNFQLGLDLAANYLSEVAYTTIHYLPTGCGFGPLCNPQMGTLSFCMKESFCDDGMHNFIDRGGTQAFIQTGYGVSVVPNCLFDYYTTSVDAILIEAVQVATFAIDSVTPLIGTDVDTFTMTGVFDTKLQGRCLCAVGSAASVIGTLSNTVLTCPIPSGSGTGPVGLFCSTSIGTQFMPSGRLFTYRSSNSRMVLRATPTTVAATAATTLVLTGDIEFTGVFVVGFVLGTDCNSGRFGDFRLAANGSVPITFPAATTYSICASATGFGGPFLLQDLPGLAVTAVANSASIVASVYPTVVGQGSRPRFTVTLTPSVGLALFTTNGAMGLGLGGSCSSPYSVVSYGPSFGSATTVSFTPTGPLAASANTVLCVSLGSTFLAQSAPAALINVVGAGITSFAPAVLGYYGTPLFTVVGAQPVQAVSMIGVCPFSSCRGDEVRAANVLPVVEGVSSTTFQPTNRVLTLADPAATNATWFVCQSLDGGVNASWVNTGATVSIINYVVDTVTALVPPFVIDGVSLPLNLSLASPVAPESFYYFIPTGQGLACSSTTPTASQLGVFTSSTPTLIAGPGMTNTFINFQLCLQHPTLPGVSQPRALVTRLLNDANVVTIASPAAIGSGIASTFALALYTGTFGYAPTVAFAPLGACSDPAQRTNTQPFATTLTNVIITVPISFGPPSVTYALCFTWGTAGAAWVEQSAHVQVVVLSNVAYTAAVPFIISNQSAPVLTISGLVPTASTSVGVTVRGTGCMPPLAATSSISTNVATFPAAIQTAAPTLSLCQSIDGGLSYVEQLIPALSNTVDPDASVVISLLPRVIGSGVGTAAVVLTTSSPGTTTSLALTLSSCAVRSSLVSNITFVGPSLTVPAFPVPALAGLYSSCFGRSPFALYASQVNTATVVKVVTAVVDSIVSISPNVLGSTATNKLVFTASSTGSLGTFSTLACFGCQIAFAHLTGSCSNVAHRVGNFPLPDNSANVFGLSISVTMLGSLGVPIDAGAGFRICFSTDAGVTWAAQSGPTLTIVQALPGTVTAVTPSIIGAGATGIGMTVTGAPLSVQSLFALSTVGNCATVIASTVRRFNVSTVFALDSTVLPDATYTTCFSVDNGAIYVAQAPTVRVIATTATTITMLSPAVVGSGYLAMMTLSGASIASGFTAYAFVPRGSGLCGSVGARLAVTQLITAMNATLSSALLVASQGNYSLCLTTTYRLTPETWIEQTLPGTALVVQAARSTTIREITPNAWATAFHVNLLLGLADYTTLPASSLIALAPTNCFTGRLAESVVNPATRIASLSANISAPAVYRLCLSVDAGANWVLIDKAVSPLVVTTTPAAFTVLSPDTVGINSYPELLPVGLVHTPGTIVAFTMAGTCTSLVGRMLFPAGMVGDRSIWATPIAVPGVYSACVSFDAGTTWALQAGVDTILTVYSPLANAITSLTPTNFGRGVPGTNVTIAGPPFTPLARIAFAPQLYLCSNLPMLEAVTNVTAATGYTVALSTALSLVSQYRLCFSVNGGASYVEQTSVGIILSLALNTTDVTGASPRIVPPGLTGFVLSVGFNTGITATPSSVLALVRANQGSCAVPGDLIAPSVFSAGATSVTLSSPLTPGVYTLCYSLDGVTWAAQTTAGNLTVLLLSASNVTLVSPTVIVGSTLSNVTFTGVPLSPYTRIAFVNYGFPLAGVPDPIAPQSGSGCEAALRSSDNPLTVNAPGPILMSMQEDGTYGLCVSVNGGQNWVLQTLPGVRLASTTCGEYFSCATCLAVPGCEFCLGTRTCSQAANCTDNNAVCPPPNLGVNPWCASVTCPRVTAGSMLYGAYTGGSVVAMNLDRLEGDFEFACETELTNTVFRKVTNATVTGPGTIQCATPPSELGVVDARVRVLYKDSLELYTEGIGNASSVALTYYVCDSVSGCTGCWSADRPDCGYCAATQSCSTALACMDLSPLWLASGTCPTITAVSPAISPAVGGVTITVTISSMVSTLQGLLCAFGAATTNATVTADGGGVTCMTPAQTAGGAVVLSVSANGELYAELASGVSFSYEAPLPIPKPSKPFLTTPIIGGVVAGIVCLLLIVSLVAVFFARKLARDKEVQPPELTDALREQIIYGAPAVLSADDKKRLPHLDDFFNRLVMNEEFIALVGEATAATEQDKLTKCVNVVYETRGRSLDLLLFQVSREVRTSYSQSTLFRTNSFATKLFKMFSKMHGLDYVHSILGRTLNELLLDVSEATAAKGADLRSAKSGDGDAALTRFAMLTKAQRLFQQVQKTESRLPIEFRYLFRHVQACLRERFPVRNEDLAEVISSSLIENIAATSTSFSDGSQAFETISSLQAAMTGDLAQLSAVFGPVSSQLQNFEAAMKDVVSQVTKMNKVVAQLQGAVDPRSSQAQALIAQHSAKQNSIAIGGFFFLRFLVPCLTAPEAYALVHEVPDTEQRKLLVVLGKVVQNLSNGLEFGAKEAHMVQFNDFIVENQVSMNALFDKLAAIPAAAPSLASLHDMAIEVPRKRYEEAIAFVYSHTLSVIDKLGELLQVQTGDKAVDGEHRLLLQILPSIVLAIETKANASNNDAIQARINALSNMADTSNSNGRIAGTLAAGVGSVAIAATPPPPPADESDVEDGGDDAIPMGAMPPPPGGLPPPPMVSPPPPSSTAVVLDPPAQASLVPVETSLVPVQQPQASLFPVEQASLVPVQQPQASLFPVEASLAPVPIAPQASLVPVEASLVPVQPQASLVPVEQASLLPVQQPQASLFPVEASLTPVAPHPSLMPPPPAGPPPPTEATLFPVEATLMPL